MHPLEIVPELQAGITDDQRAEWLDSGPVDWANESFVIAREPDVGYCLMVGDTCQYGADNAEFEEGEPERVVVVDDDYLDRYATIARKRIAMAGIGWQSYFVGRWAIRALGRIVVDRQGDDVTPGPRYRHHAALARGASHQFDKFASTCTAPPPHRQWP